MDNKIYSIFYENYFKIDFSFFFVYIFEKKKKKGGKSFSFYLKEVVYFAYSIKMLLIFV